MWHLAVEDGIQPAEAPGTRVAGVDLAEIQTKQAGKTKGSCGWRRLQRRKSRFLAQQRRRRGDLEHKVSRAVVKWGVEQQVGTLAVGDVRDAADGVALGHKSNQKISSWSHGRLRQYITYKAQTVGMVVALVDEAYTSQECPNCHERYKPRGRSYLCPVCGFLSHRDAVGSANILSRYLYSELGRVSPPVVIKYRHPFDATGKRSPVDTGQVAWAFMPPEAPPL
jgi:putative transposase